MQDPSDEARTAKVLRSYLRGEELMTMPRPGRKRQIILEHVVQRFEPGRHYAEIDVNQMLRSTWRDVAALRRYLVDAGLLDREFGFYWRCGGFVDVDPAT